MAAQLLLNGLVTGLLLALPALALTLIFGILKFANFAVGSMLTLGAYAGYVGNVVLGWPLAAAAALAAATGALACLLSDALVFERLRERGSITLLVASMGVSLVIENICRFTFGNAALSFDIAPARPIRWQGIRINHEQIVTAAAVVVILILLHILLTASPLGRAMRAVADNPALAAVRGIERRTVARITWALTGAVLGGAGVLAGLDRAIDPLMGWNYQIPIFAAAILGGLGSPVGAVAGALMIGVAEEMSALILPTNYRQVVSFAVILVLLLFRTNGLFGAKAVRK
ncbi:branched-chain amino acid ABC transporter permease [Aquabacter spiritensis]|uniref:Branched-chain amino acid transport system permease protein n=1 Tax=Aquabacter spiritensis TaxID=933073 RepID=A0A4R3LMQ3_9HYPH|nr:branched-chain amino acid ABC transporter permease [Aquabacter spiritensis]TCT01663.1 branched-chain amino acid transport system permease protein [Aquabacter spiritensis]